MRDQKLYESVGKYIDKYYIDKPDEIKLDKEMDAAFRLKNSRLEQLGKDFLIESEVEYPCLPESWKKSEQ